LVLVQLLKHILHLTQEHQEEVIQVLKQLHQPVVEMVVMEVLTQETLEDQAVEDLEVHIVNQVELLHLLLVQHKVWLAVIEEDLLVMVVVLVVEVSWLLDLLLIQELQLLEELEVDFQML
tara:strand:+ start:153 stop:512 length:360 start_codon:yes stop_codon:yes gene_type:complete